MEKKLNAIGVTCQCGESWEVADGQPTSLYHCGQNKVRFDNRVILDCACGADNVVVDKNTFHTIPCPKCNKYLIKVHLGAVASSTPEPVVGKPKETEPEDIPEETEDTKKPIVKMSIPELKALNKEMELGIAVTRKKKPELIVAIKEAIKRQGKDENADY